MATEAAWLNRNRLTERRKRKCALRKKKEKLCLDINRPSHGRPYVRRVVRTVALAPDATYLYSVTPSAESLFPSVDRAEWLGIRQYPAVRQCQTEVMF